MEAVFECKVKGKIKVGLPIVMKIIKENMKEFLEHNFNEFLDIYVEDLSIMDYELKIDVERPVRI